MSQPSVIIATASYDWTIRFWEAQTTRCYRTITCPALPERELYENPNKPEHVNKLEISPDRRHLAAACNPYIRLFDINSHHGHVRTFVGHTSNVMAVGFHANGNSMYSGSEDGTVRIWDLRAPNPPEVYERNCLKEYHYQGSVTPINTVVLHPNQVITEFDPIHRLRAHNRHILKCVLSPENKYLATASSDKTVKIWNVDNFTLKKILTGHQRWVWDCAFSVDAKFLLTASSDMTARLWSMEEGSELRVYRGHGKAVVCCALNDG